MKSLGFTFVGAVLLFAIVCSVMAGLTITALAIAVPTLAICCVLVAYSIARAVQHFAKLASQRTTAKSAVMKRANSPARAAAAIIAARLKRITQAASPPFATAFAARSHDYPACFA